MKKTYMTPELRIQSIDSEDILDASVGGLPIYDENNPKTVADDVFTKDDEVLGNRTTVWDE